MKISYLNKARSDYFKPWSEGHFCIGKKSDCDQFKDIAKIFAWGWKPGKKDMKEIKRLRLIPAAAQVKKGAGLPGYVKELEDLEFLEVPFPFIENLSKDDLPRRLKGLLVANRVEFNELLGKRVIRWPRDLVLPQLTALIFMGEYGSATTWPQMELHSEHVPRLEYLNSDVDNKGLVLMEIEKFTNLRHLELYSVRDFDVFGHIKSDLTVLYINSASKNFPFTRIADHRTLTMLQLLHVRAEIDCEIFTRLPDLVEINLVGCKKLTNVRSLLSCKKLKSLELTDCGNPLKKEGKQEFKQSEFERLDIEYS
jgi:hypothetical protein